MADPALYRPAAGEIPTEPGVYRFFDDQGRVLYVGKAKSLRPRLSSYFQDITRLHPRTARMVQTASRVRWTVVATEVEALTLEYSWIKEYDPPFNVMYRDDKSYPWLAVTVSEEFPRVHVMRGKHRKGVKYFGPFSHAWAIRDTVDSLLRVFPMRSCSPGVFNRARSSGRPCLLGDIGKCAAPCVGRVDAVEHRKITDKFLAFMNGRTGPLIRDITEAMKNAAAEQEYEVAARHRDDLLALEQVLQKQTMVLADGTDADVFGLCDEPLEIAVQIFNVRTGRVKGERGWVASKEEDLSTAELLCRAILTLYADAETEAIPPVIMVPSLPADHETLIELLRERRGKSVRFLVPRRGDKAQLLTTVENNAAESLRRHRLKRAKDLTARSKALEEIAAALDLDEPPLRIECFDISNMGADDAVASMVVFEDGLPRTSQYRRFTIRHEGQSDVAAMAEVMTRRFRRAREEEESPLVDDDGVVKRFAYEPGLIVVDGGPPQVAAAKAALDAMGVDVPLCGLAKRLEEVWLPNDPDPVILSRTSEALYLLQRARDEAHRFAISHHRKRRRKSAAASALDGIAGLGEVRRKALLKHFGSVKKIRAASAVDLEAVPGIGPDTAESIVQALAGLDQPTMAVNMMTGEILEDDQ